MAIFKIEEEIVGKSVIRGWIARRTMHPFPSYHDELWLSWDCTVLNWFSYNGALPLLFSSLSYQCSTCLRQIWCVPIAGTGGFSFWWKSRRGFSEDKRFLHVLLSLLLIWKTRSFSVIRSIPLFRIYFYIPRNKLSWYCTYEKIYTLQLPLEPPCTSYLFLYQMPRTNKQ